MNVGKLSLISSPLLYTRYKPDSQELACFPKIIYDIGEQTYHKRLGEQDKSNLSHTSVVLRNKRYLCVCCSFHCQKSQISAGRWDPSLKYIAMNVCIAKRFKVMYFSHILLNNLWTSTEVKKYHIVKQQK